MKNIKLYLMLALIMLSLASFSQERIAPYFKLGQLKGSIEEQKEVLTSSLENAGFKVIGDYQPAYNNNLFVMAYTNDKLIDLCLKFEDRGLHAAALKIGLVKTETGIVLSMLNPEYQFRAYLVDGFDKYEKELLDISKQAIESLKPLTSEFIPFGGNEKKGKLYKYHYKMMMPYFTDPIELNKFSSFEEGLKTIRKNLQAKIGNTAKVYEIVDGEKEVAVFGVALNDEEEGEKNFLPIIGESHIAAMPYDLILQGNTAYMLHGRFRFAIHWPELTMGTFMKIMSTPKSVKKFMEELTK